MSVEIYYFSGTGNSLAIAMDIAKQLKGSLISIPSLMELKTINIKADLMGIVFPVYYAEFGGVPLIMKNFIKKLANLNSKYIFAVCTHTGGPGETIRTLGAMIEHQGGKLATGFTVKMSVPYSIKVKFRRALFHKENNSKAELIKDAPKQDDLYQYWLEKLDDIIERVNKRHEGVYEYKKKSAVSKILFSPFRALNKKVFRSRYKNLVGISKNKHSSDSNYSFEDLIRLADNSFEVNGNCNGCGICARICPVNNIKIEKSRPIWLHICENCYACYVWCPNDAIHREIVAYNKKYHHPDLKVSDMIMRDV